MSDDGEITRTEGPVRIRLLATGVTRFVGLYEPKELEAADRIREAAEARGTQLEFVPNGRSFGDDVYEVEFIVRDAPSITKAEARQWVADAVEVPLEKVSLLRFEVEGV